MEATEWALRKLEGTVLSYLRGPIRKKSSLNAVRGDERLARGLGTQRKQTHSTIQVAIEKSPNRNSPEADALRKEFPLPSEIGTE
jgi:hypothetical protein